VHTASLEKDGESFTLPEALLFTFRDGKVIEIQDFFSDIALNDRLFS
jgi:ketosteroid isomerase-like protein